MLRIDEKTKQQNQGYDVNKISLLPITSLLLSIICLCSLVVTNITLIHIITVIAMSLSWSYEYLNKQSPPPDLAADNLPEFSLALQATIHHETTLLNEDIERLKGLINDSSQQLQASFQAISSKNNHKQELFNQYLTQKPGSQVSEETVTTVSDANKAIHSELNNAIHALQFEDLVIQLSDHIIKRIEYINCVGQLLGELSCDTNLTKAHEKLTTLNVEHKKRAIGDSVQQKSMDEGDVELF
ncbi:hypothetical protein OAV62_00910 [bacterium]|nr:hypothetical protein [bacterium]